MTYCSLCFSPVSCAQYLNRGCTRYFASKDSDKQIMQNRKSPEVPGNPSLPPVLPLFLLSSFPPSFLPLSTPQASVWGLPQIKPQGGSFPRPWRRGVGMEGVEGVAGHWGSRLEPSPPTKLLPWPLPLARLTPYSRPLNRKDSIIS